MQKYFGTTPALKFDEYVWFLNTNKTSIKHQYNKTTKPANQ